MAAWRREAIRRLPGLRPMIEAAENPYALWIELLDRFHEAYEGDDEQTIAGVYSYLRWTQDQPEGQTAEDDLFTAAACCFVEHMADSPKARADMPRWFSRREVLDLKSIFTYSLGEDGFVELLGLFPVKSRGRRPPPNPGMERASGR